MRGSRPFHSRHHYPFPQITIHGRIHGCTGPVKITAMLLGMTSMSLPLPFDTRRAAHERISPAKQEIYRRILGFAHWNGHRGFTADELAVSWGCSHNHVAPRICELNKSGKLVATSRTRRTRTGSPARVYVAPEFA